MFQEEVCNRPRQGSQQGSEHGERDEVAVSWAQMLTPPLRDVRAKGSADALSTSAIPLEGHGQAPADNPQLSWFVLEMSEHNMWEHIVSYMFNYEMQWSCSACLLKEVNQQWLQTHVST